MCTATTQCNLADVHWHGYVEPGALVEELATWEAPAVWVGGRAAEDADFREGEVKGVIAYDGRLMTMGN